MKRTRIILLAALTLLVASITLPSTPLQAADPEATENITLTPAVSRPTLDAGQNFSGKLTIINDGTSDYTFLLYARPFSVTGEQYDPNYTEINEKTQAYQWVAFEQTKYRLAAGQEVEAPYTVNVPKNAAGGGHYAVLFAETQPEESDDSSVMRKKRVGSLLYMTVNGEVKKEGSLESWDVSRWQTSKPLVSTARLKNTGNTHFQADAQVHYSNLLGKKRLELNKQLLILPGTTRRIPFEWADAPAFGVFRVSGTIKYLDKSDALPERYIVFLPTSVLAAGLAVLLSLALLVALKRHQRNKTRTQ